MSYVFSVQNCGVMFWSTELVHRKKNTDQSSVSFPQHGFSCRFGFLLWAFLINLHFSFGQFWKFPPPPPAKKKNINQTISSSITTAKGPVTEIRSVTTVAGEKVRYLPQKKKTRSLHLKKKNPLKKIRSGHRHFFVVG